MDFVLFTWVFQEPSNVWYMKYSMNACEIKNCFYETGFKEMHFCVNMLTEP